MYMQGCKQHNSNHELYNYSIHLTLKDSFTGSFHIAFHLKWSQMIFFPPNKTFSYHLKGRSERSLLILNTYIDFMLNIELSIKVMSKRDKFSMLPKYNRLTISVQDHEVICSTKYANAVTKNIMCATRCSPRLICQIQFRLCTFTTNLGFVISHT